MWWNAYRPVQWKDVIPKARVHWLGKEENG